MNINDFCQQMSSNLDVLNGSFPEESFGPVRDRVQKFNAEFEKEKRPIPDIVKALFDLSEFVQAKSSTLPTHVLSDTFIPLISKKIQELASIAFPSGPDQKQPSSSETEIKALQAQLAQANASLDAFLKAQKTDPETAQLIQSTIEDIDALTARLDRVQKENAAAQATAPLPLGCAGMRNRSNKCYAYGCLKGLWASKKFRDIIEQKAKLAEPKPEDAVALHRHCTVQALSRLFFTFDATRPSEVLEPEEKAITDLFEEMSKNHPALAKSEQQDATEFLNWMFDDIFEKKDEYLFSYTEYKRRPMELKVDFCIPNIDVPQVTTGNLFVIQFPDKEGAIINPQTAFDPDIVEEGIDPASILTAEQNKGRESFEKLEQLPGIVHVQRTRFFKKEPPCLFVHLWRQLREVDVPLEVIKAGFDAKTLAELKLTDEEIMKGFGRKERVKIPAQAKISEILSLQTEDKRQIRYRLKSVIIHSGIDGAGHYYSYLPVNAPVGPVQKEVGAQMPPQASGSAGLPPAPPKDTAPLAPHFTCHNDHRVFDVPFDTRVEKELEQEGYILIYDKEE
jgi:hypothetical protein